MNEASIEKPILALGLDTFNLWPLALTVILDAMTGQQVKVGKWVEHEPWVRDMFNGQVVDYIDTSYLPLSIERPFSGRFGCVVALGADGKHIRIPIVFHMFGLMGVVAT